MRGRLLVLFPLMVCGLGAEARAVGEGKDGFPSWAERVLHEWMNRARSDPQSEMKTCGDKCSEGSCYMPQAPLAWDEKLNRAARFHAAAMAKQGFFSHDSACTLVQNVGALFPNDCDGAATCACVGGAKACSPTCTSFGARVSLFGASASGEIIASGADPDRAFYLWLFEPATDTACKYGSMNGHRYNLLMSKGGAGFGVASSAVGDFGSPSASPAKVPSGSHYPRQAAEVDFWANWYDSAGPARAAVNVDGTCTALERKRGDAQNGAYTAKVGGLGSGCHRYRFEFVGSDGATVLYPSTGSLGVGPSDCADWSDAQPTSCVESCSTCTGGGGGSGGCSFAVRPSLPLGLLAMMWLAMTRWKRRRGRDAA